MPDDQMTTTAPPAPPDLPTTLSTPEPDDMFSGVADVPAVPRSESAEAIPPVGERAASGGGIGKMLLLIGGGILILGIIAVVVWLTVFRNRSAEAPTPAADIVQPAMLPSVESRSAPQPAVGNLQSEGGASTPPVVPTANIPPDSDGDGLSDDEERALGTDESRADTDTDGLSDREEIRLYKTDPFNADSDGDTYPDGSEVRGGYDPKGRGKLFEVPRQASGT